MTARARICERAGSGTPVAALGGLSGNFVFAVNAACFRGGPGNPTLETTNRVGEASVGELFSFFLDGHPLRSFCAEVPASVVPKFPIFSVHFSDSGADASHGLESVALQFV